MNMIEKVARALCDAEGLNPDKLEPGNCVGDWEGVDGVLRNGDPAHFIWRHRVDLAKAAIEAMRLPTPEMTAVMKNYVGRVDEVSATYIGMIEEALKAD